MKSSENCFNKKELVLLQPLTSPAKIQVFLDSLDYSAEKIYRCPRSVMRDRKAHCYDGAVFAAAALRRIGYPPLILEMRPNKRDDDHILALYKHQGYWGAVAKSNFTGLRFREPIHRTLRELAVSYFEGYYNVKAEKTLRGYTAPMNLKKYDPLFWTTRDETMDKIARDMDDLRYYRLITSAMAAQLARVDKRSYAVGMLGVNKKGLFVPGKSKGE